MKRSVNFSYMRQRRNPVMDVALFMRDAGYTDAQIIEVIKKMQPTDAAAGLSTSSIPSIPSTNPEDPTP